MAFLNPGSRFLLIDGHDVLGPGERVRELEVPGREADMEETVGPNSTRLTQRPTGSTTNTRLIHRGFYQTDTYALLEAIAAMSGTLRPACWGDAGTAIGDRFEGSTAIAATVAKPIPAKELTKGDAEHELTGGVDVGVILHGKDTEETADFDTESSPVDNASPTSDGAAVYFQTLELTLNGYDDFTPDARHSSDDITYVTLATGTAVTDIDGERVEVAGTVNRYLACGGAFGGSGSSPTVKCFIGVARK